MVMQFQCCAKNSKEAKQLEKTYDFLRAIADPNRLRILCLLRKSSMCVCEIFPSVDISQKLASHHLAQLKKIGIVQESREGNFIRYSLDLKTIKQYKSLLNRIIP